MSHSGARERGVATVVIIAVFAVLAVLAASLLVVSTTQQAGSALDIQGTRAYYAARGGLEWGLYRLLKGGANCAAIDGQTFTYAGNLTGFRVSFLCTESVHKEVTGNVTMSVLTAIACNDAACPTAAVPPPASYVERRLRVTVGSN